MGTAGGILVGVNTNKFEILSWQVGSFSVASMIKIVRINLFGDWL
jgi:hypothetical protein